MTLIYVHVQCLLHRGMVVLLVLRPLFGDYRYGIPFIEDPTLFNKSARASTTLECPHFSSPLWFSLFLVLLLFHCAKNSVLVQSGLKAVQLDIIQFAVIP